MSATTLTKAFVPPPVIFTERELERITNLADFELRQLHPDGFGMPGHWYMERQSGKFFYTDKGVSQLAVSLHDHGFIPAAMSLRVELKRRMETPSAALIAPRPKSHFAAACELVKPFYREGQYE